jgi:hypothetical protein
MTKSRQTVAQQSHRRGIAFGAGPHGAKRSLSLPAKVKQTTRRFRLIFEFGAADPFSAIESKRRRIRRRSHMTACGATRAATEVAARTIDANRKHDAFLSAPTRHGYATGRDLPRRSCWARRDQLTNAALAAWFGAFEEPPRMSSERDTCNVHVKGNSAISNATADAYGYHTHSETLTQTWSSQGDATHVGYSGSVSESVSASTGALFHW